MAGGKTPRRKGDDFERRVQKRLIAYGYFAIRQPRSRFPDLIAIRHKEILIIECKKAKYISQEERDALREIAQRTGGNPMVAYKSRNKIVISDETYQNPKTLYKT